jgi:hypothetical protein
MSLAFSAGDKEGEMLLRTYCYIQTRRRLFITLTLGVLAVGTTLSLFAESAHAQGLGCTISIFPEVKSGGSNEKAFERALKWSMKYWKIVIQAVLKVWCSVLSEYDIPCGG